MKRGVRVVTIRGVRVAVDARASRARGVAGRPQASSWGCERSIRAGRAALLRTAKACGSGTRGWCQIGGGFREPNRVSQNRQFAGDGGKRNSSPGRARYKPSNHCAGKAGGPADTCMLVCVFVCLLHTRPRVPASTRSSLRPLIFGGLRVQAQLGRYPRRGKASAYLPVVPANAGTHNHREQYSCAPVDPSCFNNNGRGVWVPAFAGTTW